jgi:hypothetical protein
VPEVTPPAPPVPVFPPVPLVDPSIEPSFFLAGVESLEHPDTANIAIAAKVSHARGVSKVEPNLLEFMYVLQNCSEQRQPSD